MSLPLESILSHISIMGMFHDNGCSLLESLFDKILSSENEFFLHNKIDSVSENNIYVTKKLIYLCGSENVNQQCKRLRIEDQLELYKILHIEVVTAEELKMSLINGDIIYNEGLLATEIGRNATIMLISECDCSSSQGIKDAIMWLERYIGKEPNGNYERIEWNMYKNSFIRDIALSADEYLKVLLWAMYFQSSGNRNILKNVYCMFPTSLQVRVLKKLFCAMAQGKISPSISYLKQIIGAENNRLSLPIEIVLKYLDLKIEDHNANMTDSTMLSIFQGREDYKDWFMIHSMLTPCEGRLYNPHDGSGNVDSYRFFNGSVRKCNDNGRIVYRVVINRNLITCREEFTNYNNKLFDIIADYISISFEQNDYNDYYNGRNHIYNFDLKDEQKIRIMAQVYRLKMDDVDYDERYILDENEKRFCCECRLSNNLDEDCNK